MSSSYMHINETVEVQLFDPISRITYTLYLSEEDANKCQEDEAFAQSLLFHAKVTKAQKKNDSHDAVSRVDVSEVQQDSKISSGGSWSVNETNALISSFKNFCEQFDHATKRKHVWQNISNQLLSLGIEKSAEKCEIEWRNLLRTYKSVKDNKKATGRGATRFLYFDRIDEILGSKLSVSCPHMFSSSLDNNQVEGNSSTSEVADNIDNGNNYEIECTASSEGNANNDPHGISKKRKRNYSDELRQLKIRYFKKKEEETTTKENRKEEQVKMQKKLIELEEKKVALLEKFLNETV